MYQVTLTRAAQKDLASFDAATQKRAVQKLRKLAEDPRGPGSIKLSGQDVYRVRFGDYRVVYTVDDQSLTVTINRIGNRRDVYR